MFLNLLKTTWVVLTCGSVDEINCTVESNSHMHESQNEEIQKTRVELAYADLKTLIELGSAVQKLLTRHTPRDNDFDNLHHKKFNSKPIDKIGAGDSMVAILSLFLKNSIDPSVSLLIASLISADVVNNIGNSYTANKIDIERKLELLLK